MREYIPGYAGNFPYSATATQRERLSQLQACYGTDSYEATLHSSAPVRRVIMSPGPSMIGNESYSPTSFVSYCMGPTVVIESGGGWELDINGKILFDDRIFLAVQEWFGEAYSMMQRRSSMCVAGKH